MPKILAIVPLAISSLFVQALAAVPGDVCSCTPSGPGWQGAPAISCQTVDNWHCETSPGSTCQISLADRSVGRAVRFDWTLASGGWAQVAYVSPQLLDLSRCDVVGISLCGSEAGTEGLEGGNVLSVMLADEDKNGGAVFIGVNLPGVSAIGRWMNNLSLPTNAFYKFWGPKRSFDWKRVRRVFVVVKTSESGSGGGSGMLQIGGIQFGRAKDWVAPTAFQKASADPSFAEAAANWIRSRQTAAGVVGSWAEEPEQKAYLYDQALALLVLTNEGQWTVAGPANEMAEAAARLVQAVNSRQKSAGYWPRRFRPDSGEPWPTGDPGFDYWIGDQAWWVYALAAFSAKADDRRALQKAKLGAEWLYARVCPNGQVVPSTEGSVDACWAAAAMGRSALARKIFTFLANHHWDRDRKFWWRGNGYCDTTYCGPCYKLRPDPMIVADCQSWLSEMATSSLIKKPQMGLQSLNVAYRTLTTCSDDGLICGLDAQGRASVNVEMTCQYIAAGGQDAQSLLDQMVTLQSPEGGMPGSTDDYYSGAFGWLTTWHGIAPTAWFYFAVKGGPFHKGLTPPDLTMVAAARAPDGYTFSAKCSDRDGDAPQWVRLEYWKAGDAAHPTSLEMSPSGQRHSVKVVLPPGRHYWRVRASDGLLMRQSSTRSLTVPAK